MSRRSAWAALTVFAVAVLAFGVASRTSPHGYPARDALVPSGWLTDDSFLTGYGLAQAMPGPLFAVAAYLGALAARAAGLGSITRYGSVPGMTAQTWPSPPPRSRHCRRGAHRHFSS